MAVADVIAVCVGAVALVVVVLLCFLAVAFLRAEAGSRASKQTRVPAHGKRGGCRATRAAGAWWNDPPRESSQCDASPLDPPQRQAYRSARD